MKAYIKISDERVADMLVGALEGGSNYWIEKVDMVKPTGDWWVKDNNFGSNYYPSYVRAPLSEGGALRITLRDDYRDERVFTLTREMLEKGWQTMIEKNLQDAADIISETDDATTADVFLQCVLFGEVVYG